MIDAAGLSACISSAIEQYVAQNSSNTSLGGLEKPLIRIDAFLEDGNSPGPAALTSRLIASTTFDLKGRTGYTPVHDVSSPVTRPLAPNPSLRSSGLSNARNATQPPGTVQLQQVINSSTPPETPPDAVQSTSSTANVDADDDDENDGSTSPRKAMGGLRLTRARDSEVEHEDSQRQLEVDGRNFPKRRKLQAEGHQMQPSSLDKLIIGIWEQLHGTVSLDPPAILDQVSNDDPPIRRDLISGNYSANGSHEVAPVFSDNSFSKISVFCRKVTQASRACRSVELMVQALWIDHFDAQVEALARRNPGIALNKHRKVCINEACQDFMWSEKELRNKTSVWRGYKEVKDAAGWAALVFSGMGLYRFCKYRVGFDKEAIQRLRSLKHHFEVAADTMHPHWRQLLPLVGESSEPLYTGHPHDWVISESGAPPIPLRSTYLQWDPHFTFEHIDDSIVDTDAWGSDDPRWLSLTSNPTNGTHTCEVCGESQSDDPANNTCQCFPDLFGCVTKRACPVQVFRTSNGRNNGLIACCPFERGASIGEFTGLLTKSLANTDVMTIPSRDDNTTFQIHQKRYGNHTRFVNHSCNPNAQFQQFIWCNTQRVVLVSRGIAAGEEILVDYSDRYWDGLEKVCLCGEPCCRYKKNGRGTS